MPIIDNKNLKVDDTHTDYDLMLNKWLFWSLAYDGDDDFIKSVILQHDRESISNFATRRDNAEVFNYSATIIDLYSHYLSQSKVNRELGSLADDELWKIFNKDVDLYGTDYDVFWISVNKTSSVYGFCGILVDKPKMSKADIKNKQQEINDKLYPYYSLYTPENITDWTWKRDPQTARPILTYLKLREREGSYLVWTRDEWERWSPKEGDETNFELVQFGDNPLKEIPFVWVANYTNMKKPHLGVSDLRAIARIQANITRDLSHGEEIIKYAAFPMMRKPQELAPRAGQEDVSGVTAILEFDPEHPESKPDWLDAKVKEPIDSILDWIDRKVSEVYRTSHLSSVHGQFSKQAKSGVALRYEFQQLSSVLSAKGAKLDEAEMKTIYFWKKWQNDNSGFVEVSRPGNFNIEDLTVILENVLLSKNIVRSLRFNKQAQKRISRLVLPDAEENVFAEIDKEIETQTELDVIDFEEDEKE